MPAINMASNDAQGASGKAVLCSPFSGPQNSPFDARTITSWPVSNTNLPVYANDPANKSTGALQTGIGFGIGTENIVGLTAPQSIKDAGFSDDYAPGVTLPGLTAATTSILTAIGGGKSTLVNGTGPSGNGTPPGTLVSSPVPYVAQPLLGFGNGGSRDAGAGPVYTGFGSKMVTATGAVAVGAAIEAGFLNRTRPVGGAGMVTGQSAFGSATAASPAVT